MTPSPSFSRYRTVTVLPLSQRLVSPTRTVLTRTLQPVASLYWVGWLCASVRLLVATREK
ncbi:hypothetical protein D3C86_1011220 [compost metagenome]